MNDTPDKIECETDRMDLDDVAFLRRMNANEKKPFVEASIPVDAFTDLVRMRYQNECWTWSGDGEDGDYPKGLVFDVRAIKDEIAKAGVDKITVIKLTLTDWLYKKTLLNCDEPFIERVNDERMQGLGIIVMMPGQKILMIDGNHRLCARWRKGLKNMRVAFISFGAISDLTWVPGTREDVKVLS